MAEVLNWTGDQSHSVVTRALKHLRAGEAVVFPTESVYMVAVSPLAPHALAALERAVGKDVPVNLVLGDAVQLFDWLPNFRGAGIRLARRFWPGPLALVSGIVRQGLMQRLPGSLRQRLAPEQQLRLALPDHPALRLAALALDLPLVAAPTPWLDTEDVCKAIGKTAALVIGNGRTTFARTETVVEAQGRDWRLLQEGAIAKEEIANAASCRIVFVCTGNTCRSPLAEGICRKLLADKLGCGPHELAEHNFVVQSAGLAAMMGVEAAPEAVGVAGEFGVDLSAHSSQPLTIEMLLQADRLFAMTGNHVRMLHGVRGVRPRLLDPRGGDVADPIGCTAEVYRECAQEIKAHLEGLLPELLEC